MLFRSVGAYAAGSDALADRAIAMFPRIEAYLQQGMQVRENYADSVAKLRTLIES